MTLQQLVNLAKGYLAADNITKKMFVKARPKLFKSPAFQRAIQVARDQKRIEFWKAGVEQAKTVKRQKITDKKGNHKVCP